MKLFKLFFLSLLFVVFVLPCAQAEVKKGDVHIAALTKIIDTNMKLSGEKTAGKSFSRFDELYLSNGKIVFQGYIGKEKVALYTTLHNMLETVVDQSVQVPEEKSYFRSFSQPILFDQTIIFLAKGTGGTTGIYRFEKGKISVVVNQDTVIPNTKDQRFTDFMNPGIMSDGKIGFIGMGVNSAGIYSVDEKGNIKMLVDNQTNIPKGKGNFINFSHLAFSKVKDNSDDFIFWATGQGRERGLYLSHKGKPQMIANQNTPIPGGSGFFVRANQLRFDAKNNNISFVGEGVIGQQGVYFYDGKNILKVADQKTVIPDELDQFTSFGDIDLEDGKVIFCATGHKGFDGVYLYTSDAIFKVLTTLDKVGGQAIQHFDLGNRSFEKDQLALILKLKDNSSGIYVTQLKLVLF